MEELIILIVIALISIVLYLTFSLKDKLEQLDLALKSSSAETAWKICEKQMSANLHQSWQIKELEGFKEAVEYFIENESIVEAHDKIKELVQSFKKTDTSTNN